MPRSWADTTALLLERIDTTLDDGADGFPHYAEPSSGRWIRSPAGDWTGGFWVGELWLAAAYTNDGRYREAARAWAERLRPRAVSETVFRGFLFWYGAALGSIVHGDELAQEIALVGARGLAEQYDPHARLIPLGNRAEESSDVGRGDTNIDGVPGTTLLLAWASAQIGSDSLRDRALTHALRHAELCVRADGSVCQSASFDPTSGRVLRRYTHKGITDGSTWTRAQAWAMLGFAHAASLDRDRFLPIARTVADWWIDHLPEDRVARWDFDATGPDEPHDTSGTAIASAALLKLARLEPSRAASYTSTATGMVTALVERHVTPVGAHDRRRRGMLVDGCYNRRLGLAVQHELIWGDYFLLECLLSFEGAVDTASL